MGVLARAAVVAGVAALSILGPLPPAPVAHAEPSADFACGKPVRGFGENEKLSRYTLNVQERVFIVKVYLGLAAGPDGIAVAPGHNGVCRLVLPVGDYLLQPVTWREANVSPDDKPLYKALDIFYAGGSRSHTEWLLLRQRDAKAAGVTTLEFHVIYDQLSAVQN
jgi:hypothetical protein